MNAEDCPTHRPDIDKPGPSGIQYPWICPCPQPIVTAKPRNNIGWCPECGCSMTAMPQFGEIVCDDYECAYVIYTEPQT